MKSKSCKECSNPVWGGGYCQGHQYKRGKNNQLKRTELKRSDKPMKRTRLNAVSSKQKELNKEYSKVRAEVFKDAKNKCEVCKAAEATDCHHKAGRTGTLTTDKRYLMAVCRSCHDRIHTQHTWALENQYILLDVKFRDNRK